MDDEKCVLLGARNSQGEFRRPLDAEKSDEKKIRDKTEHRSMTVGWRAFGEEKNVRSSKKRMGVKIIGKKYKFKNKISCVLLGARNS
jgi:hypothetical protein